MLTREQADALARPFEESEIEWRVGQAGIGSNGPWVRALAYLTSRGVMDRLDEVFGVGGWSHSIREIALGNAVGVICRLEAAGTYHEDVAECSDIEALKGAASGGLKRAAVAFGVGRYLYFLEDGFAKVHPNGRFRHFGKDKKSGKDFDCKWDPPRLPDWALPPKGAKRFNPYAEAASRTAVGPGSSFPPSSAPTDSSEEFEGLVIPEGMDPKFVEGIHSTLRTPKAAATLRATYTKAVEKALALGVRLVPALDPKMFPIELANHVLDAKAKIVEAESKKGGA